MATAELGGGLRINEESAELASDLRRLGRAATLIALLTSPALMVYLYRVDGWSWWTSVLAGLGAAIAFRGFVDVLVRRLIPWPSLFNATEGTLREEDIVSRRRAWFWKKVYRLVAFLVVLGVFLWLIGV